MSLEVRDPGLRRVVGEAVSIQRIATGFAFTEGALWQPQRRELYFSDIPNGRIHRWSEGAGVAVFREPSHKSNGLTWDRSGRLLACEHVTSRVTRTEADGRVTVLASHYGGKQLNSPNDIVVRGDGRIFFTDPTYGRMEFYGVPREPELGFRGVYALDAEGGEPRLLADDFAQPNGLCFSLDERRLFVNDTERQHIRVFDVAADGSLSGGAVWAQTVGEGDGAPDGMKLDSAGNIYCCGPGGVHVFAPDARCLGVIRMPEYTANFCFGGEDLRTLFVCASTSIYALRVKVPGRPLL
ncbi:MAG: SMP-30/gluconolactonase/LRE family protein [Rhodospirillaceae bacterium]|nr:SMP-30/gluconolactonase/LRE family protein [Rhodospirillaceae bacterium]